MFKGRFERAERGAGRETEVKVLQPAWCECGTELPVP
jgi:hypothetical protein